MRPSPTAYFGTALVWVALTTASCVRPPAPPPAYPHTLQIGLCEDYPEESRTLAAAREDLERTRKSGAVVLRVALGWDAMEPEPSRYDWSFWDEFFDAADAAGVQLIPYICYTPRWAAKDPGDDHWRSPPRNPDHFGRFVEATVRHFRGRVRTWELWNEPDNPEYWRGSVAEWAALFRSGSMAVRRADPDARVVLGGLAGKLEFLEVLFRDEHLAPHVDIVNFHSYFETWHPAPIEQLSEEIRRAREMVKEYGENEPLWMAETGYSSVGPRTPTSASYWPTYADEHTPEAQANALARTLILGAASGELQSFAWYRLRDLPPQEEVIGDDNNRHLGLYHARNTPKPSEALFSRLARLFRQPYRIVPVLVQGKTAPCEIHAFEFPGAETVLFAWLPMPGTNTERRPLVEDTRVLRLEVSVPVGIPSGELHLSTLDSNDRRSLRAVAGAVQLPLELHGSRVQAVRLRPAAQPRRRKRTLSPTCVRAASRLRPSELRSVEPLPPAAGPFRPASPRALVHA